MSSRKQRALRVCLTVAAGLLAVVGYALFFNTFGFGMPCAFHLLTGLDCAACGLSRAAAALLRLDFAQAFTHNAMWPLFLAYPLWTVPATAIPYVKWGRLSLPKPLWLHFLFLALLLLYGVLRNFL